ncbi:MAG: HAMP domain-containing sensor histidine kinase [Actinomycetota bacterium]
MSGTIFKTAVQGPGDPALAGQRARQVSGLLGFGEDEQALLDEAVRHCAEEALERRGGATVEYLVDEGAPGQAFEVRVRTRQASEPHEGPFELPAPPAGMAGRLDRFEVVEKEDGSLEFVVALGFGEGSVAVASEALAGIAAELARRSRPQSFFSEIGERNQELFRAVRQLSATNRQLEEYTQEVSHDLKGPLTGILLANEVLREKLARLGVGGASDPDIERLVDIVRENVNRSAALIDDLLVLAEAGSAPTHATDVDLGDTVREVLRENALDIEDRGVSVVIDPGLGSASGSPTHFYQLFSNLIRNALKYNDSDEPVVEVRLLGEVEDGRYAYLVRDNGSGIDPDELVTVFEPFTRGSSGDTGIGLATAAKVCRMYGGDIEAYNDDGACFRFTLPGPPER